jgi:uncharacterized membrane-anchored protein YjiN (DUF445 family)
MRFLATALLVLMAACFIAVTLLRREVSSSWLPWIAAFSEAAMVGALADWFASSFPQTARASDPPYGHRAGE